MKKQLTDLCPLCKSSLFIKEGDAIEDKDCIDPRNGFMVFCDNMKCIDSGGHGKNEGEALKIFKQKCGER